MIPLQGLVTTLQGQVTALQGQVMALQGQVTALQGQQGPAGGPAQPELPEEAGVQVPLWTSRERIHGNGVGQTIFWKGCQGMLIALLEIMTVTHECFIFNELGRLGEAYLTKYCPRKNEMKKLEAELWNLDSDRSLGKIERYVGGLPDMIHGNIVASRPKTMQEAIEMATELMDKREYGGNANNTLNNQKAPDGSENLTVLECRSSGGHFKKECPRMKNNKGNRGNQAGNDRAPAKVYVVGNAGANPDNVLREKKSVVAKPHHMIAPGAHLGGFNWKDITSAQPSVDSEPQNGSYADFHLSNMKAHKLLMSVQRTTTNVYPPADTDQSQHQQELDLLFGPLYDEFFNDGTSRVNKSSSPTDNSVPQDTHLQRIFKPTQNHQLLTNAHAVKTTLIQEEFSYPFCTPV
ncbi:hypothetical protein Tco_0150291 [Tanacetum coccineum]